MAGAGESEVKNKGASFAGEPAPSPKISHSSWGQLVVDGIGEGKDFKLWPGGGRAWDWAETGTQHDPGIQPADVAELLHQGSQVIVLSRGRDLQLRTSDSTIALLEEKHVAFHIDETQAAVERYNGLADQGIRVGGLFHSTC